MDTAANRPYPPNTSYTSCTQPILRIEFLPVHALDSLKSREHVGHSNAVGAWYCRSQLSRYGIWRIAYGEILPA